MFKKIKELLDAGTISEEAAKALDAEVSAELTTLRAEAKTYRTELEDSKGKYETELKTTKEQYEEQLKTAKEQGKDEIVAIYETKVKDLADKLGVVESEKSDLMEKTVVGDMLAKVKPIDRELAELYIKQNLTKTENGYMVKVGENTYDLDTGATKLFEAKPHLLEAVKAGPKTKINESDIEGKDLFGMSLEEKLQLVGE